MKRGRPSRNIMCLNDACTYTSLEKAAKSYGVSCAAISQVVNGKRKTVRGLIFIFISGNESPAELAEIRRTELEMKFNMII